MLLMAILLWPVVARAANETGMTLSQLHEFCSSTDTTDTVSCTAYFAGFIQGIEVESAGAENGKPICFPENISVDQVKLFLDKIARNGPQYLSLPAAPALAIALQAAFPCPKKVSPAVAAKAVAASGELLRHMDTLLTLVGTMSATCVQEEMTPKARGELHFSENEIGVHCACSSKLLIGKIGEADFQNLEAGNGLPMTFAPVIKKARDDCAMKVLDARQHH